MIPCKHFPCFLQKLRHPRCLMESPFHQKTPAMSPLSSGSKLDTVPWAHCTAISLGLLLTALQIGATVSQFFSLPFLPHLFILWGTLFITSLNGVLSPYIPEKCLFLTLTLDEICLRVEIGIKITFSLSSGGLVPLHSGVWRCHLEFSCHWNVHWDFIFSLWTSFGYFLCPQFTEILGRHTLLWVYFYSLS